MKKYLLAALSLLLLTAAHAGADTAFEAPIAPTHAAVISHRFFKSTDGSPAINFQNQSNNELVVVENCVIHSNGEDIVKSIGFVNVIFRNNIVIADDPLPGKQRGRINMYNVRLFDCQHNTLVNTGGIFVDGTNIYLPEHKVFIGYNWIINTDKRRADGTDGAHRASIQVSSSFKTDKVRICFNKIVSQEGKVSSEDGINLYNTNAYCSGGKVLVDHNLIWGQYPYPANADKFSGSGITVDGYVSRNSDGITTGGNTPETAAGDADISYNTVLEVGNAAGNIMNGGRSRFHHNLFLNTGYLTSGDKWYRSWSGTDILNSSKQSAAVFYGNSIDSNVIAFRSWGAGYPFPDRQDENNVLDANGNRSQNEMPKGQNFYLPYGYPTKSSIDSAAAAWEKMLKDSGYYVGATPTKATVTGSLSLTQYDSLTVLATPLDTAQLPARYTTGSFRFTSSDTSVATIVQAGTETQAKIYARKPGTATITGYLTTQRGNPLQKSFDVQVLYLYPEPVDISFTFSR